LVELANRWLGHLEARQFAAGTVRGYAFDLLCLARLFDEAGVDAVIAESGALAGRLAGRWVPPCSPTRSAPKTP